MSNIERVYVAGYRYDLRYARCCVASIRFWYPDVPITLIKDRFYGDYNTGDIESYWNVDVLDIKDRVFSWGFSKFEPLFLKKKERILILDADTIILGKLFDLFESGSEDFVVSGNEVSEDFQRQQYYDLDEIKRVDPEFQHPGYAFNTGQFVATSGIFSREELADYVSWDSPPQLRHENLFKYGDQGLFNYFLFKQQQLDRITLKSIRFMETGDNKLVTTISPKEITLNTSRKMVVHWAGIRCEYFSEAASGHLLQFFESVFYSKVPCGKLCRRCRIIGTSMLSYVKKRIKGLLGK